MAQLKKVVEPFGEVNVYPGTAGKKRVVATILMEPHKEGAQTGIALDGSGSMAKLYGVEDGSRVVSSFFSKPKNLTNEITPVAQKVCAYLARKIDADGGTTCIYWATGPSGSKVEVVGDLTADQAERHVFGPPKDFGTGTQLLPAVRYFVERFRDAPWGFYVFITDGELHDLDDVLRYCSGLAKEISAKRRNPLKFVLIGIGPSVNESQMQELDDMKTGTDVDLWDHKLAAEMRMLEEIFAEVVDRHARVAPSGKILDPQGKTIKDYSDTGLPAYLEFEAPANAEYFTLEVGGKRVHQGLSDTARVPASDAFAPPAAEEVQDLPTVEAVEEVEDFPMVEAVEPAPKPVPKAPPRAAAPPPAKPAPKPAEEEDPSAAEWKSLPLEFKKPGEDELKLDKE